MCRVGVILQQSDRFNPQPDMKQQSIERQLSAPGRILPCRTHSHLPQYNNVSGVKSSGLRGSTFGNACSRNFMEYCAKSPAVECDEVSLFTSLFRGQSRVDIASLCQPAHKPSANVRSTTAVKPRMCPISTQTTRSTAIQFMRLFSSFFSGNRGVKFLNGGYVGEPDAIANVIS